MLNRDQFNVLRACAKGLLKNRHNDIDPLCASCGFTDNSIREMRDCGFVSEDFKLTNEGRNALAPYKVDNAIILAAGMATRFAPLSFERPKALFEVRGELLIERMICQIKEAGIDNIAVVVGYMKESFFYLENDFGIKIVVNNDYAIRNNHSSIWCARELLGNTYIVSSDQYYTRNVFEPYCFVSTCSATYSRGLTEEQVLVLDNDGVVMGLETGGSDSFFMQGPVYVDREFSHSYLEILEREYDQPETIGKLWEQVFAGHTEELHMVAKVFEPGVIYEFDRITDLVAFDRDFFANVDSRILDNICRILECKREDIAGVTPIKAGLTNLSTLFTVRDEKYIYRHPGTGTEEVVNRAAEAYALRIASDLGLDDTYIYADPDEGWKISRYIEDCTELDYSDRAQVERALQMARALHTSGKTSPWSFDFLKEGENIAAILRSMSYPLPRDFDELEQRVSSLAGAMRPEVDAPVLCHNDFYGPNILVRGDEMRLIDWEYAAMGDPMCDIGNFIAQGSGYSVEEAIDILPLYYGRETTEEEKRHCIAAVGIVGWYWYVWAMYKEAMGNPVGEWLYIWYRAARTFVTAAEGMYS